MPDPRDDARPQTPRQKVAEAANRALVSRYLELTDEADAAEAKALRDRIVAEIDVVLEEAVRATYPERGIDIKAEARVKLIASLQARSADAHGLGKRFRRTVWTRATDAARKYVKAKLNTVPEIEHVTPGALARSLDDPRLALVFALSLAQLVDGLDPKRRLAFTMWLNDATQEQIAEAVGRSVKTIGTWQDEDRDWVTILRQKGFI